MAQAVTRNSPYAIGHEFIRQYYTLMNRSPKHMHLFYDDNASFTHDHLDFNERRTDRADEKTVIRAIMVERSHHFTHTSTYVHNIEAVETINDGLIVQVLGEISFNQQAMRPFSQSVILYPRAPNHYFVQNDIFRFLDHDMDIPSPVRVRSNASAELTDQTTQTSLSMDSQASHSTQTTQTNKTTQTTQTKQTKQSKQNKEPKQSDSMEKIQAEDWGTQCEEYIEPYEEHVARQNMPRASHQIDYSTDEVKLDTSDSGLSSDAEKAIMDIQSLNLKTILQESKTITKETVYKRVLTPPTFLENEPSTDTNTATATVEDISENHTQLFRDSCILTIGNVINPNIELFDEDAVRLENATTSTQFAPSDNDKTQENIDAINTLKNDENSQGKLKYRKRKNKLKVKNEMQKDKLHDECIEKVETEPKSAELALEQNTVSSEIPANTIDATPTNKTPNENSTMPTQDQSMAEHVEQETPKASSSETKTYADLAKEGSKEEWIDELATQRDNRNKSRPPLVRRVEKTTPPNSKPDSSFTSRSSPKNDQCQVFIGNIPHTATEEGIRKMFSRFGRITRLRLHSNNRKDWLPYYAFITYETIQSAKYCLMKKSTFYWPENNPDGQKLNVNGDPSIDVWEESGSRRLSDPPPHRGRELRQFSKNFVLGNKEGTNKRSPDSDTNVNESAKNERRKGSNKN
ncbi:uncharacterized protein LOC116344362 isoform X2 [Contarinia nasturtii]|uniref:uncharacterized protein LOC116344362 isoform X2 n=1 Tax=Contarinia nasturtii TaxID=265458 RepID=UPI0012D47FBD|nr:uncharacterized protein LOC116344362 isoform X2 [Contarinia nasturtii]